MFGLLCLFCPAKTYAQTGIEGRPCAPEGSTTTLGYGDVVTCEINPATDTDSFSFAGATDEYIAITFSRTGTTGLPCARLIPPGGTAPAYTCPATGQTSNTIERRLTQSGVYVIEVAESGSNELLNYVLSLERLAPASPAAMAIQLGDNLAGEINPIGDIDLFSFAGTSGETVYINISRTGTTGLACIRLVEPDGVLGTFACPGTGQIAVAIAPKLTKTGAFVIQVLDSGSNAVAGYNLSLDRLAPAATTATAIQFGDNLTGEINPIGDTDLFSFSGTSGETVYINISRTGTTGLACIRLVEPDGVLGTFACPGTNQIAVAIAPKLTKTGTFVIQVVDSGADAVASYNLSLDRLAPATATAAAMQFGDNLTGEINPIGETDLFRFAGTSGETIYINISRTGTTGQGCIRLVDPDGVLGTFACPGTGQIAIALEPKLTKTGTFVVQVVDNGANEVVGYNLTLDRLAPTSPAARFIEYGQDLDDEINPIGDTDLFFMLGTSTDTLAITLSRRTGTGQACLRLIDPDGIAGAYVCPAANQISLNTNQVLSKSGPYAVQIIDLGSNENVGYRLNVRCTGTCPTPPLEISTTSPLLNGTAGTAYSFSLVGFGGKPPYVWSTSSGSLPPGLSLQQSIGIVSGTPSTSGSYTFTVQVSDSVQTTVTKALVLTVNAPATLTITTALPSPNGVVGASYSQLLRAEGGPAPFLWAISAGALPTGLTLDPSSGSITGTFAGAGTFQFTIRVTDSSQAVATRNFSLIVLPPPIPALTITGLTTTVGPAEQPSLNLNIAGSYPFEIRGQVLLSFAPDAVNAMDDAMIQFLTPTGGRVVAFTIPANATSAVFPTSPLRFQTGTVAGTITLRVQGIQVSGFDLTPSSPPTQSVRLNRSTPTLTRGRVTVRNKTTTSFEVVVEGFSTPREITEAVFRFTPASGSNLTTTELRISLSTLSGNWYRNAASAQSGSQFMYVQVFVVQGNINAIGSISVSLRNSQGESEAESTNFN